MPSHTPAGPADLLAPQGFVARLMPIRQLNQIYRRVGRHNLGGFGANLLAEMDIDYRVSTEDLKRIPKSGGVLVVSNHPFGMLDGLILAAMLPGVRPDVKIVTNSLLRTVPELDEFCLFVDPFGRAADRNRRPIREALSWLNEGHMLVVFPSGEVSHWSPRNRRVEDPDWTNTASRLARLTQTNVLPIFFKGSNSVSFHALGLVHPVLRTARLGHEFLKARGKTVDVSVGNCIPAEAFSELTCEETTRYLRWRTYLLAKRGQTDSTAPSRFMQLLPRKAQEPVCSGVGTEALAAEVSHLPAEACLGNDREFAVFLAACDQIPNVLAEIGRLRELTFRAVSEGTGKATDLDNFDLHYQHLFVWHKQKQEVVGAYRIGDMRQILTQQGTTGLYTNTLFRYSPQLFAKIGPALELGRSFVRPEYQRQYAPLLLLWKAIGQYVARNPEHAVLFGAVSISSGYSRASRELLVGYYGSTLRSQLAGHVRPRRSFRTRSLRPQELQQFSRLMDTSALGDAIADLEIDGKEIPILLRQYVKLGGELLGFNVDDHFSDVVDGLIVVDLRKTNPTILERYMGREGAAAFFTHHSIESHVATARESA